jgi:glycosyltransferase involved in cell wall biosynthesis
MYFIKKFADSIKQYILQAQLPKEGSVFTRPVIILNHYPFNFSCDYISQMSIHLSPHVPVVVFNPFYFPSLRQLCLDSRIRHAWIKEWHKQKITVFPSVGLFPFQRFWLMKQLNTLINIMGFYIYYIFRFGPVSPLLWVFTHEFARMYKFFFWKKGLVYDRADHPASLIPQSDRQMKKMDSTLIQLARVTLVNSPFSFRYVRTISPRVLLLPWGFNQRFLSNSKATIVQNAPRIGIVGHIDHRFAAKLLRQLAHAAPLWNFYVVGGIFLFDKLQAQKTNIARVLDSLKKLKNVFFVGEVSKVRAISYMRSFDVCLVLYDTKQEFVRASNPMKVYEYLGSGKPVVSVPIESLRAYSPAVSFAATPIEFYQHIKRLLSYPPTTRDKRLFQHIARSNSWAKRVELSLKLLESLFLI